MRHIFGGLVAVAALLVGAPDADAQGYYYYPQSSGYGYGYGSGYQAYAPVYQTYGYSSGYGGYAPAYRSYGGYGGGYGGMGMGGYNNGGGLNWARQATRIPGMIGGFSRFGGGRR